MSAALPCQTPRIQLIGVCIWQTRHAPSSWDQWAGVSWISLTILSHPHLQLHLFAPELRQLLMELCHLAALTWRVGPAPDCSHCGQGEQGAFWAERAESQCQGSRMASIALHCLITTDHTMQSQCMKKHSMGVALGDV